MSQLPYLAHYGASGKRKAAETHPSYWCEQTQTRRLADGSGDEITGQWCTPHWPAHGGYTSELRPGMFGGSPNATLDTPLKKAAVGAGILAILGSGLYIASKRGAIPGVGSMAEAERKNIPWWLVGGLTVLAAGDAVTPGFPFPGSALLMVPLAGAAWVAKASQYGVPAPAIATAPAPGSSNMGNKANEIFGEIYTALLHHPDAKKSDFTALEQLKGRYLAGDISLVEIEAVYQ
jgi:hypothetical protein